MRTFHCRLHPLQVSTQVSEGHRSGTLIHDLCQLNEFGACKGSVRTKILTENWSKTLYSRLRIIVKWTILIKRTVSGTRVL